MGRFAPPRSKTCQGWMVERRQPRQYPDLGPLSADAGAAFRQLMQDLAVTQYKLARQIGRDDTYILDRLRGDRPFSLDLVAGLAQLTRRDEIDLLNELADRIRGARNE